MRTSELFGHGRTVFSFEVFPPKKTSAVETIYDTLKELRELSPDFISVTYGAGGSGANSKTAEIASYITNELGITAVAHLTCINNTKEDILAILDEFKRLGIENILALRGDVTPDITPKDDFRYASDLVSFIKQHGDFDISGGCYPDVHFEAPDAATDIENLKKKTDAGAEHLISQLFFDNRTFYDFRDRARAAGINVPIEAGIMPVVNTKQIERMVALCGASLPPKFSRIMQKYENDPEALCDAGIAYAVDQIVDLIANDVDGIHLYTMNKPYIARRIADSIRTLL
ncbi:MAG: methylenetetrahydrofolate reductase [Oscillospiraceae bacterium]|nr:methylenetetrahydrofolate reductase [NAD(P)H] [Oscillospiraceae bacterium]MBQ4312350.1 methylenetetrahydrofolate reductase [NAD(P)H] [Oscillospiraceae bacterium]MCR5166544.1 methylenetetrahydrofolate reductase [NAD(P)H] [Oscillospiraceae bacterium]